MKHINPIVLDFETSGLDLNTSGIWQIGAIDLNNPDEFFLEEGRIDEDDLIDNNALEVVGKTEEELRDKNKQSQKQLFERFLNWMKGRPVRNFLCQGPQWDVSWLIIRTKKYGLNISDEHCEQLKEEYLKDIDKIIVMAEREFIPDWLKNYEYEYWDIPNPEVHVSEEVEEIIKLIREKVLKLIQKFLFQLFPYLSLNV